MENMCRTCLRTPINLLPLYENQTIMSRLEAIASIQVTVSKKYPSSICEECILNINRTYNFLKVVKNNDKDLKERVVVLERSRAKEKLSRKTKYSRRNEVKSEDDSDVTNDEICAGELDNMPDLVAKREEPPDINVVEMENEVKDSVRLIMQNANPMQCDICDQDFPSRSKLSKHKRLHHIARGICNICGMSVRADNLRRHVLMHSAGPAECHHCGKVFKNPDSLRGHLLIHRGMEFKCELCGKVSKIKAEHKRHMMKHADPDIRKSMCSVCGKKVKDMKRHIYTHTGERPYLCNYCSKGFASPYALKVHTRQHTNEKPYICEFCDQSFPQKVSLCSHVRSKHGEYIVSS